MTVEVCPFCGGASSEQFDAREMMMGLRELFRYRRCGSCKSLWLADPPADMSPFYRDDYYSFGGDPKGAEPIRGAYAWTRVLLQLPDFLVQRLAGRRGFP